MAIASVPDIEPTEIYAGDSVTWKIENSDYTASAGWTLKYVLLNSSKQITITSSASGDDHLIELSTATTGAYTAGTYDWRAYFYDDDEQYPYKTGTIIIHPNWASQTTGYDTRSHAKTVLDAIEALIEGRASQDQMSIKIGDRELTRMSPNQLIEWRNFYREEYQGELDEAKIANGDSTDNQNLYGVFQ